MLAYTIKSVIFLSMMYIPYMLMLKKESFFHFNRILLVSIMLLSLILPLCDFHALSIENNPIQHGMIVIGTPTTVVVNAGKATTTESFNWFVVAFYVYIIGFVATFIWKIIQLIALYGTIRNCILWKDEQDGITIYLGTTVVLQEKTDLSFLKNYNGEDLIVRNKYYSIDYLKVFDRPIYNKELEKCYH